MKLFATLTTAVSALLLSTAVSATLQECQDKSDIFRITNVSYAFVGEQVCVTIKGYLSETLLVDAYLKLEFEHGGESASWQVPFYSSVDKAGTPIIPAVKGKTMVAPCFFLPLSFGKLEPDSQVKVTLVGTRAQNQGPEMLCVSGYITTK